MPATTTCLRHGVNIAHVLGGDTTIWFALGAFDHHHGDGLLIRASVGFAREVAISALSEAHNPTLVAFDADEVREYAQSLGIDLTEGSMPEFMAFVEGYFVPTTREH